MNVYPGDLLVQEHHKKLIKRNTISDFYAGRNGSTAVNDGNALMFVSVVVKCVVGKWVLSSSVISASGCWRQVCVSGKCPLSASVCVCAFCPKMTVVVMCLLSANVCYMYVSVTGKWVLSESVCCCKISDVDK